MGKNLTEAHLEQIELCNRSIMTLAGQLMEFTTSPVGHRHIGNINILCQEIHWELAMANASLPPPPAIH